MGRKELALLLVSLIWGTTFALAKFVLGYMPILGYLALRFFLAAIFLFCFYQKMIRETTRKELLISCLLGVCICFAYFTQSWGLHYTTASKNAFICGLYVVIVPYFAYLFFHQSITRYAIWGAVLAVCGLGCLSINGSESAAFSFGDLLAFLSAIFTALQIVCIGRYAKKMHYVKLAFFQMVTVCLLCSSIGFLRGELVVQLPWTVWATLVFLSVFATAGAFLVQCWAQKDISHGVTAIIFSMESVFGALFACLFFSESFSRQMLLGCVFLFAAMIFAQKEPKDKLICIEG